MKKLIYYVSLGMLLITFNSCEKESLNVSSNSAPNKEVSSSKLSNDDNGNLCHNGVTINVNKHSIKSHMSHDDIVGSCEEPLKDDFWFSKIGLSSVIRNKDNSQYTNLFFMDMENSIREEFESITSDEYLFHNKKIGFAFQSKLDSKRVLVITPNGKGFNEVIITEGNTNIELRILKEDFIIIPKDSSPVLRCSDLGPRSGDETFGDCFSRNWNNFCCDFIGCAAQIGSGHAVAVGIGLACL